MKSLYPIVVILLFFNPAQGQIIDKIKSASDEHNSSSSSSGTSSSYDDDEPTYYYEEEDDDDDDEYYYYDEPSQPYYNPSPQPYIPTPRTPKVRDSNYKYQSVNLIYRRTIDARKVLLSVPEGQIRIDGYYASIRINQLIEPRAKEDDRYSTVDCQLIGFQTNPNGNVVFNLSTGFLSETYSGEVYIESVMGLRVRVAPRFHLYGEGRWCRHEMVTVRSEMTLGTDFIFFKNPDIALCSGAFFTSSLYYEKVPVEGYGLSLSMRF